MRRLSIDVTPEQHQRLKAIAALRGQTIKEYVLERVLPEIPNMDDMSEEEALQALEDFLKPRIEAAERGEISSRSVNDILEETLRENRE